MTRKQVSKKVVDFCIFSFGVVMTAVALTCVFQLLRFYPNEFVRSILTVVLLVLAKLTTDKIAWLVTSIAIVSIALSLCFFGIEALIQSASSAVKLVLPFVGGYGVLLLAVNLMYVSDPSFWNKVHRDKENGVPFAAMLPDLYRMVGNRD